jgi:transposase
MPSGDGKKQQRGSRATHAERIKQAFTYRVRGFTYRGIAELMGVSMATAADYVSEYAGSKAYREDYEARRAVRLEEEKRLMERLKTVDPRSWLRLKKAGFGCLK